MSSIENIEKGIEIAKKYGLYLPHDPVPAAVKNREIAGNMIANGKPGKYQRKKSSITGKYGTYCGQLTSAYFRRLGFDMNPFLGMKPASMVNTTGQYKNAIKNKVLAVSMEEAFYLACVGRPCLILSPRDFIFNERPYNHAAGIWPIFTEEYNRDKGPKIFQEGWFALINEYISDPRAWGEAWQNKMIKCFVPEFRK